MELKKLHIIGLLVLTFAFGCRSARLSKEVPDQDIISGGIEGLFGDPWYLMKMNAQDYQPGIWMRFLPDWHIKGFGGCNQFQAIYSIKEDTISIEKISSTKKYCPDYPDETEFFNILNATWTIYLKNDSMKLEGKGDLLFIRGLPDSLR